MPLNVHEAAILNELLLSCTNSIISMGVFIHQIQDLQLKGIVQTQLTAHMQDYNMKVEYVKQGSIGQKLDVPVMSGQSGVGTHKLPQAVLPDPTHTAMDDRAIAVAYLLMLKRAGREYAWGAFEACDPPLRGFLEDAFTMCSRHALEVQSWLERNGYYPTEPASLTYLQRLTQTYKSAGQVDIVQ